MTDTNFCPCGNEIPVKDCCLTIIEGKRDPATAEELLRARYTAFTRGDVDFILETHHSSTHDQVSREEIEDWSKNSVWHGLKIVQKEAGTSEDQKGSIIFAAHYEAEGKSQEHWEKSFFEKENGKWRFLDAQGVQVGPFRRSEPKVGRNDPCSCGSGKKFKKCCAA
jgi:SEC-C motif domain protein